MQNYPFRREWIEVHWLNPLMWSKGKGLFTCYYNLKRAYNRFLQNGVSQLLVEKRRNWNRGSRWTGEAYLVIKQQCPQSVLKYFHCNSSRILVTPCHPVVTNSVSLSSSHFSHAFRFFALMSHWTSLVGYLWSCCCGETKLGGQLETHYTLLKPYHRRHRLPELAFQPCVGKKRIAYNPSLHRVRVHRSQPVAQWFLTNGFRDFVPRLSHTSLIEFIFSGGRDKYVIFIWV